MSRLKKKIQGMSQGFIRKALEFVPIDQTRVFYTPSLLQNRLLLRVHVLLQIAQLLLLDHPLHLLVKLLLFDDDARPLHLWRLREEALALCGRASCCGGP